MVNYPSNYGTPTVNLLTVKLLLNSVVSMPGAKFVTIDIKYFYLNMTIPCYKYMGLKLRNLPEDFVRKSCGDPLFCPRAQCCQNAWC